MFSSYFPFIFHILFLFSFIFYVFFLSLPFPPSFLFAFKIGTFDFHNIHSFFFFLYSLFWLFVFFVQVILSFCYSYFFNHIASSFRCFIAVWHVYYFPLFRPFHSFNILPKICNTAFHLKSISLLVLYDTLTTDSPFFYEANGENKK